MRGVRNVIIAGGSGFIGEAVAAAFIEVEWGVVVLDRAAPRYPGVAFVPADLSAGVPQDPLLRAPEVVVNLAGAPVFQPWTEAAKREILESRVLSTRNLVAGFADERNRPKVLVQASAVGFYGDTAETHVNESSPRGAGFLADVCEAWEAEARQAEAFGVRVVIVRQATVLGSGGYLGVLAPAAKWGFAGRMGGGAQFVPWIHRQDLASLYRALALDPTATGAVNAVAPAEARQFEIAAALRRALRAPWELPVPAFALRLKFGQMADELALASQRVEATRLPAGFTFAFPRLEAALEDACAAWRA
jgi:uncharacterized protein (TIGR01777 family)